MFCDCLEQCAGLRSGEDVRLDVAPLGCGDVVAVGGVGAEVAGADRVAKDDGKDPVDLQARRRGDGVLAVLALAVPVPAELLHGFDVAGRQVGELHAADRGDDPAVDVAGVRVESAGAEALGGGVLEPGVAPGLNGGGHGDHVAVVRELAQDLEPLGDDVGLLRAADDLASALPVGTLGEVDDGDPVAALVLVEAAVAVCHSARSRCGDIRGATPGLGLVYP